MPRKSPAEDQVHYVNSFQDLVSTSFYGKKNAMCWTRELIGNFSEIIQKAKLDGNITVLEPEQLLQLELSEQGELARKVLLNDLELLTVHGASPTLNIINYYERDHAYPFFPTDVYSFHVDRSPIPTSTFLCTYYGESSEIISNSEATQKILVPEIQQELKKIYKGKEENFDSFLIDHFFDLHYLPKANAQPITLGLGNLWKLAVDHPQSQVLPCIHRAPKEKTAEARLLLIC